MPSTRSASSIVRIVAPLVLLVALVVAAAGAIDVGTHPFGSSTSNAAGCRERLLGPSGSTGDRSIKVVSDATLIPLGVICQATTLQEGRLSDSPIMHFRNWPATAVLVLAVLLAALSVTVSVRAAASSRGRRPQSARSPH